MLKIWGRATSSNVQKVLWCCAELGIDYERVDLGGPFGGNRDPEYLAMNPNGRVPTIKDDGLILWESNTICRYLAATRHGERLYPSDPGARANVERWMDWQLASSGPPMAALLGMLIRARPEQRDQAAIGAARLQALAAFGTVTGRVDVAEPPQEFGLHFRISGVVFTLQGGHHIEGVRSWQIGVDDAMAQTKVRLLPLHKGIGVDDPVHGAQPRPGGDQDRAHQHVLPLAGARGHPRGLHHRRAARAGRGS